MMGPTPSRTDALRRDAQAIWTAAIAAVLPTVLLEKRLAIGKRGHPADELLFDGRSLNPPVRLDSIDRVSVVGAGKAAAQMASGVEQLLGRQRLDRHRTTGVVSVPEGSAVPLSHIHCRETRPAGANIPTALAVAATQEMISMLSTLGPNDLAIAVVTGGGSALLVAPREGVSLEDTIAVTNFLSAAGATIQELNAVRQAASTVKAGGFARACHAGRLVVLVLSDVVGNRLDVIASGPCMPIPSPAREAFAILNRYGVVAAGVASQFVRWIESEATAVPDVGGSQKAASADGSWTTASGCRVSHLLIGSNETAVQAAAAEAIHRGYTIQDRGETIPDRDGHDPDAAKASVEAETIGWRLALEAVGLWQAARDGRRPLAIIEGGEATVQVPADHGTGGRNQQTVLAAMDCIGSSGGPWPEGLLIASVGTDGEDGPTDAAGGYSDAAIATLAIAHDLDVTNAAMRCDAYPLLNAVGGLIRTGPSGTNVADVRIVLARPPSEP
jgi:glycerate-2-kinase